MAKKLVDSKIGWTITRTNDNWYQVRHENRVMATRTTATLADGALKYLERLYGDSPPAPSGRKRGHYAYEMADGFRGILYAAKTLAEARADLRYSLCRKRLPNGTKVFRLERE